MEEDGEGVSVWLDKMVSDERARRICLVSLYNTLFSACQLLRDNLPRPRKRGSEHIMQGPIAFSAYMLECNVFDVASGSSLFSLLNEFLPGDVLCAVEQMYFIGASPHHGARARMARGYPHPEKWQRLLELFLLISATVCGFEFDGGPTSTQRRELIGHRSDEDAEIDYTTSVQSSWIRETCRILSLFA